MAKSKRGFASMDEEKQRAIASLGGKASPQNFAKNRELASKAGRIGGSK
ncbi:MAG TPA: KGG domain-containing protein [Candidatus Saccharimonadales bacterium]|nr:KGG domain-containing protein [Candidatus Saccharimonadales bacterium]